nr:MAG TPA: hypothetical protein [Caudoviricetes sp.]
MEKVSVLCNPLNTHVIDRQINISRSTGRKGNDNNGTKG